MADQGNNIQFEARTWCAGTLLVIALIIYGAWSNARGNERLAQETHSTGQVAPASTGTPPAP